MTRSMTGFGRATGSINGETYTIELNSVNHRFFDCTVRLPTPWMALEGFLRERVKADIARGKIYVSVRRDRGPGVPAQVNFDAAVAAKYIASSRKLAQLMVSSENLSLDTLAQLDGVFYQEELEQNLEEFAELETLDNGKAVLAESLGRAVENLNATRAREGGALVKDLRARIDAMRVSLSAVESRLPELSAAFTERLRERLEELCADSGIKEERIAIEVAMMAEKTNVNEELVRLEAHFQRIEQLLESKEPIGRELNFLSQEIQREANTLGSKIREVGVVCHVVAIKTELEKFREQVQNIE